MDQPWMTCFRDLAHHLLSSLPQLHRYFEMLTQPQVANRSSKGAAGAPQSRIGLRASIRSCHRRHTLCNATKELWVQPETKGALTAALEAGVSTFLFPDSKAAQEWSSLAKFRALHCKPKGPVASTAASEAAAQASPASSSTPVVDEGDAEVARIHPVSSPADLKRLEAQAANSPEALGVIAIMDAADWKIIPAENLVALLQAAPATRLMATVGSAEDAQLMLGALQVGTDGVILRTGSAAEVRKAAEHVAEASARSAPPLSLEPATVVRVTPLGIGDRVCVDLASMLVPGEGMLAGSFARGLFLVHSECEESAYINSRPFRVNAGAVHAYVYGPKGRTAYLAELRSGQEVVVVDPQGRTRKALVGRCKLEQRPLVLVEARAADGSTHSVLLQNAETVKLVGLPQGLAASSSSDASGSGTAAGTGTGVAAGSKAWRTISVAAMQPGDVVMLHRPATAARHMGIAIQEHIVEQ